MIRLLAERPVVASPVLVPAGILLRRRRGDNERHQYQDKSRCQKLLFEKGRAAWKRREQVKEKGMK
jgi:hypothetical protein